MMMAGKHEDRKGFVALVHFVHGSRHQPASPPLPMCSNISGQSRINIDVDEYLGSGAFSSVYMASVEKSNDETEGSTSCVMKVAKSAGLSQSVLENELNALKELNALEESSHPSIPKLHDDEVLKLKVRMRVRCRIDFCSC